jgi:putative ABC transport system permease protein
MSRQQLFLRMLVKAAWVRKDRALTALISVAVVATIATAALTVYYDLENKLSREFRSFGANVIVTAPQRPLTADALAKVNHVLAGQGTAVPVAYAIANAPGNTRVVAAGTDLKHIRELNSWWSVREVNASGDALIGARVAERYSPAGQPFAIDFAGHKTEIKPQAIFTSGSDDDSRIYLDRATFASLAGVEPNTALVRVEGRPREVQAKVDRLVAALPGLEVKPVRQITQAQTSIVGKTRSVVLTASAIVLVLIMLCMIATFTSSVLERRRDFAVMKALGASNRTVNVLFAAEASLLAIAGAAAGYIVGSVVAFWIGRANFDAAIWPQASLIIPVLAGSVVLALVASTAPLRLLQQIQPATILRGE